MNTPNRRSNTFLRDVLNKIDPKEKARTSLRMALAAKIDDALIAKGWSKSFFAEKMGKQPSEITKWLSGTHNFTVDTLSDIQHVLGIKFFVQEEQSVMRTTYIVGIQASSTYNQISRVNSNRNVYIPVTVAISSVTN